MRLDRTADSRKAPQRWSAPVAPSAAGESGGWIMLGISLICALFLGTMAFLFVAEVQRYREAQARFQAILQQWAEGGNGSPRPMFESLLPYLEPPSPYSLPSDNGGSVKTFITPSDTAPAGSSGSFRPYSLGPDTRLPGRFESIYDG